MNNSARTLYIIGNGFDRWHGLPTSFWHFKQYLRAHHPDISMAVRDYLAVDSEWRELEQALATLDTDLIEHNFSHLAVSYSSEEWSDSGHHDYQYEVDRLARTLSTSMRQALADWIRGIDVHQAKPLRLALNPSARYLSFNYTPTLEQLYGILDRQVLHLHGDARLSDDLVLGHAYTGSGTHRDADYPRREERDTRLSEVDTIVDHYFSGTFKPSKALIQRHRTFFEALDEVDEVVIYGHSAAWVDAAYYGALLATSTLGQAHWVLPSTDLPNYQSRHDLLVSYGVPEATIRPARWQSLDAPPG